MFADYDYYKESFGGSKIKDADEYKYLAQQAALYIKKYTHEVTEYTMSCECAIAEYLQGVAKQGNMTSENIPNFYSVSWSANTNGTRMSEINAILELYLGDKYASVGVVKLIG